MTGFQPTSRSARKNAGISAIPCGLSFVLPLGSPPLAIAFASGEYKVAKVAGWGVLMDLIPVPLTMAAYWFFWR